jgi:hypothetical protein
VLFSGALGDLVGGVFSGLFSGLVGGLFGGLIGGLDPVSVENKTVPNQGIRQSAQNAIVIGLVFGLTAGLIVGLVGALGTWLVRGQDAGLTVGVVGGLYAGLIVGLIFGLSAGLLTGGGRPIILHFSLRYVLWRSGYMPWRYARFLDYAAERILLRKVGGGYIFVHRLLQEYFASLWTEEK